MLIAIQEEDTKGKHVLNLGILKAIKLHIKEDHLLIEHGPTYI